MDGEEEEEWVDNNTNGEDDRTIRHDDDYLEDLTNDSDDGAKDTF